LNLGRGYLDFSLMKMFADARAYVESDTMDFESGRRPVHNAVLFRCQNNRHFLRVSTARPWTIPRADSSPCRLSFHRSVINRSHVLSRHKETDQAKAIAGRPDCDIVKTPSDFRGFREMFCIRVAQRSRISVESRSDAASKFVGG
jgi:hypothetical protein